MKKHFLKWWNEQTRLGETPSEQNARLKTEIIAMNVLIKDAYEFLDSYGVVYDAGDKRGITQQALFDRMREVLK